MRRKASWALRVGAVLLATLLLVPAAVAEWKGNIHFMFGPKTLDDDFEPAEDQTQFGASFTFGDSGWPVMLAVDVMTSSGDGSSSYSYYYYPYGYYYGTVDAEVNTLELAVGVRKEWGKAKVHPFLGGGIEFARTDAEVNIIVPPSAPIVFVDDSDSDVGYWVSGGVYWDLGEKFNLGLNIRYSDADATLRETFFGTESEFDASSLHYGILAGWRW